MKIRKSVHRFLSSMLVLCLCLSLCWPVPSTRNLSVRAVLLPSAAEMPAVGTWNSIVSVGSSGCDRTSCAAPAMDAVVFQYDKLQDWRIYGDNCLKAILTNVDIVCEEYSILHRDVSRAFAVVGSGTAALVQSSLDSTRLQGQLLCICDLIDAVVRFSVNQYITAVVHPMAAAFWMPDWVFSRTADAIAQGLSQEADATAQVFSWMADATVLVFSDIGHSAAVRTQLSVETTKELVRLSTPALKGVSSAASAVRTAFFAVTPVAASVAVTLLSSLSAEISDTSLPAPPASGYRKLTRRIRMAIRKARAKRLRRLTAVLRFFAKAERIITVLVLLRGVFNSAILFYWTDPAPDADGSVQSDQDQSAACDQISGSDTQKCESKQPEHAAPEASQGTAADAQSQTAGAPGGDTARKRQSDTFHAGTSSAGIFGRRNGPALPEGATSAVLMPAFAASQTVLPIIIGMTLLIGFSCFPPIVLPTNFLSVLVIIAALLPMFINDCVANNPDSDSRKPEDGIRSPAKTFVSTLLVAAFILLAVSALASIPPTILRKCIRAVVVAAVFAVIAAIAAASTLEDDYLDADVEILGTAGPAENERRDRFPSARKWIGAALISMAVISACVFLSPVQFFSVFIVTMALALIREYLQKDCHREVIYSVNMTEVDAIENHCAPASHAENEGITDSAETASCTQETAPEDTDRARFVRIVQNALSDAEDEDVISAAMMVYDKEIENGADTEAAETAALKVIYGKNSKNAANAKKKVKKLTVDGTLARLSFVRRPQTIYGGLPIVATIARQLDIGARWSRMIQVRSAQTGEWPKTRRPYYSTEDIIIAALLSICTGSNNFDTIESFRGLERVLGFRKGLPSVSRFRQRLNEAADYGMEHVIREVNYQVLKAYRPNIALYNGYLPVDGDVTVLINEKNSKEGTEYSYLGRFG